MTLNDLRPRLSLSTTAQLCQEREALRLAGQVAQRRGWPDRTEAYSVALVGLAQGWQELPRHRTGRRSHWLTTATRFAFWRVTHGKQQLEIGFGEGQPALAPGAEELLLTQAERDAQARRFVALVGALRPQEREALRLRDLAKAEVV